MSNKDIYILALNSICDDTSAAILKNDTVLSNKVANQSIHKKWRSSAWVSVKGSSSNIIPVVESAIKESGISLNDISAIVYKGSWLMGL